MTLGEKIRKARTEKKMTQAELCKSRITRNMLSAIECGKAMPSLETVYFIAERLSLPASYLISDDEDLFFYEKKQAIGKIKALFSERKYTACIEKINTLEDVDDELSYVLAYCNFALGKQAVLNGSLASGKARLDSALESCKNTVYDTEKIESSILLYSALAKNLQAPLLELDVKRFEYNINEEFDYEFYKYIMQDTSYGYTNSAFSKHLNARNLMKDRKYKDALRLLLEIEEEKRQNTYNAYVIFGVYADMESCYKQLGDFENAYRYATKRLSLIEGFKL